MKKIFFKVTFLISALFVGKFSKGQCPYDNEIYLSGAVPTVVGNSVLAAETWGGEFNRLTGMVAGSTYEVTTCGSTTFDSQLTIYPAFGGTALAFDDDGCGDIGGSSKILFTPTVSGDYDILLDEYDCIDNSINMDMVITLISTGGGGGDPDVTYIPVVVHVVYENSTENISDAQIVSQINSLNNDFRKLNFDFSQAPEEFQSLGSDLMISFCLATEDPNGNPTTGITRTSTTQDSFDYELNNDPKTTSDGGKDNWDPEHYLNLWVCDLSGSLLGYATFPSDLASDPELDGVVISYKYFGTFNTNSPYDKGRTATHEIGHWLNLRHVWGDSFCGNDLVSDTPEQEDANGGCPNFPHVTCSNGPDGDMFVNYMDYTNDACMMMFTNGQKQRTDATISTSRNDLLQSLGCGSLTDVSDVSDTDFFQLFPNPAHDKISISLNNPDKNVSFKIYNSMGAEIRNVNFKNLNDRETSLDISNFAPGIFLIEVTNEKNKTLKKLIIQ